MPKSVIFTEAMSIIWKKIMILAIVGTNSVMVVRCCCAHYRTRPRMSCRRSPTDMCSATIILFTSSAPDIRFFADSLWMVIRSIPSRLICHAGIL